MKTLVTSQGAAWQTNRKESQTEIDIVVFEFTQPVHQRKLPDHGWYEIDTDMSKRTSPNPILFFAVGYPSYSNAIDYSPFSYSISPEGVWGKACKPQMKGRLSFKPKPEIDFDPSGMSGGPVFGFHVNNMKPEIFFAGILTNASRHIFNYVPLLSFSQLIEKHFS